MYENGDLDLDGEEYNSNQGLNEYDADDVKENMKLIEELNNDIQKANGELHPH